MDLLVPDKTHDESRQGEALVLEPIPGKNSGRKLYIESYGCAMNFSDSEIVASILTESGFETTGDFTAADVIFINTCSIRENAEVRVRNRLKEFAGAKAKNPGMVVGVLGCMAERLKSKFLEEEKLVDVVVGPDAYRDLPNLIDKVDDGQRAVNVLLSREETYADISPVRLNSNGINAFVSIMRGCDNMCSFCVVPFTRGRERSREPQSIVNECRELFDKGYREVTLLGQNVDSYKWAPETEKVIAEIEKPVLGMDLLDKVLASGEDISGINPVDHSKVGVSFAELLEMVALISPDLRVRFSTSHPKDITDDVLYTIAKYDNICNYIHLAYTIG
jgi:tRNA-2-methylthio-N6-dimethylallyladenosine synthase